LSAPSPTAPQDYRGQRLGLPASGPASIAPTGARLGAFVVDALASALIAGLFVQMGRSTGDAASRFPGTWSLIPLAVDYIGGVLIAGRTLGMYLFGLRLIKVDRDVAVGPLAILGRTLLLFLFIPAVVFDRDGRGLHDRVTETAVVRA
jgi:uncharacterized RDD family membrane protein YckC